MKKKTSALDGASAEVLEQKRKTSRISLDSVLAADDESKPAAAPAGAPKTIKLKRPSEAVTVKAKKKAPAAPVAAAAGDPSKTAPLDDAAAAAGSKSARPTVKVRKPTMKIKKSGGAAGAPAAAAATPAGAAAGAPEPEQYEDSAHWVFITFGVAAFLVIAVSIWMFTAQVIGPNYCLTQSSWSPRAKDAAGQPLPDLHRDGSTDLPWPGKLRRGPAGR